jgi:murein DD-endopeptidase MepM/ murein hydrolase activator NlpD
MFGLKKQITFYYTDHLLQMKRIRWVRLKIGALVIGSVAFCLGVLLTINSIYYNFLGIGNSRIQKLTQENQILQSRLVTMTDEMKNLKTTISQITEQGDKMRLMVDLPTMDEQTKAGGTGGTEIHEDESQLKGASLEYLQSAKELLVSLTSEMNIQQQSYQQISNRIDYNKTYFAALPAIKPMTGFYSLKDYGMRLHPVLGINRVHEGLDIIGDVGTPVVAAGDGIIQLAGHTGGGFGYAVVINHGYGYQTVYAHLSKILVREGQRIKRGDLIAKSGRSGLVSGPHLHYEVRHNGISENPLDYFFDDISIGEYRKQTASR